MKEMFLTLYHTSDMWKETYIHIGQRYLYIYDKETYIYMTKRPMKEMFLTLYHTSDMWKETYIYMTKRPIYIREGDQYIYDKETYERDVADSLLYLRHVKRD